MCEQDLEEMVSRGPPIVGGKLIMSDKYKADIFALSPFGSLLPTAEEWKKACELPVAFYPHLTAKDAMETDGREAYKRGYSPDEYRARLRFFGVLLEAAAHGSVHAQYILAKRYLEDKDDIWPAKFDEKIGMYYMKKAAKGCHPEAMCYYGMFILCFSPLPTPKEIKDALFQFTNAASQGSSVALREIKYMVLEGQATQNDYDIAESKLQQCNELSKECAKEIPGCDYTHCSSLNMDFCISNYRMWKEKKSYDEFCKESMYEMRFGPGCEELATAELLYSMIDPRTPQAYCFSYIGGWNRRIMGSLEFFDNEWFHINGVGTELSNSTAKSHIYCVIRGRMTKEQKEKVQEVAALDAKELMDTLHWYVNKSSVRGLLNITLPTEWPSPIIIEDKESWYLTDIEGFEFDRYAYYGRREKVTSPYLIDYRKDIQKFAVVMSQSTVWSKLADSLHVSKADLLTWLKYIDRRILANAFDMAPYILDQQLWATMYYDRLDSPSIFEGLLKAWKLHNKQLEEWRETETKYIGALRGPHRWQPYERHYFSTMSDSGLATKTYGKFSSGKWLLYKGWELQCLEAMGHHSREKKMVWSRELRHCSTKTEWLGSAYRCAPVEGHSLEKGEGPWGSMKITFVDKNEWIEL